MIFTGNIKQLLELLVECGTNKNEVLLGTLGGFQRMKGRYPLIFSDGDQQKFSCQQLLFVVKEFATSGVEMDIDTTVKEMAKLNEYITEQIIRVEVALGETGVAKYIRELGGIEEIQPEPTKEIPEPKQKEPEIVELKDAPRRVRFRAKKIKTVKQWKAWLKKFLKVNNYEFYVKDTASQRVVIEEFTKWVEQQLPRGEGSE